MLGQLTEMQIENVLVSQVLGRLACTDGNQPYIVPVTYAYDGKYIYGQTNDGKKLNILRKNPHVCFEVDMMSDMANWQSVLVYGEFEELEKEEAKEARAVLFNKVFRLMTSATIDTEQHEPEDGDIDDKNRIKSIMYRIKIEERSGRFERR